MSIYDYTIYTRQNQAVPLTNYQGSVLLIVNTATGCGFTPQYKELQKLHDNYHQQGLTIIDIPCNQFKEQAPESDEEIHQFCQLHYQTGFDQFRKSEVKGDRALPLYTYLTNQQGFQGFGKSVKGLAMSAFLKSLHTKDKVNDVKWNFTKFLVDRTGQVVERFEPTDNMTEVEKAIKALL